MGNWCYSRFPRIAPTGMEFKDKIMLHCFREVKCRQGFTTGI